MTEMRRADHGTTSPLHVINSVEEQYDLDLGQLEQQYDRISITPHTQPDGYTVSFSYDTDVYGPLVRRGCRNAIRDTTGPYRDEGLDDAALDELMLEAEDTGSLFLGSIDIAHDAPKDAVASAYAAIEERIARVAAMHDEYNAVADRY